MKLSEMNTAQASDAILRIAQPAANIMGDDEVLSIVEGLSASGNEKMIKVIAKNIVPVTTVALKNHREDVFQVLAALTGKTVKKIEDQKFTQTMMDIRESMDKELLDFFRQSARSEKKEESK